MRHGCEAMCASKSVRNTSDQPFLKLYTIYIDPSVHKQLIEVSRILLEAHIVAQDAYGQILDENGGTEVVKPIKEFNNFWFI